MGLRCCLVLALLVPAAPSRAQEAAPDLAAEFEKASALVGKRSASTRPPLFDVPTSPSFPPGSVRVTGDRAYRGRPRDAARYTHEVRIRIFRTRPDFPTEERLRQDLERAQDAFDQCGVLIRVEGQSRVEAPSAFRFWETAEFGGDGRLTEWEKAFFSVIPAGSAGALFVHSLDWSIELNGITAAAYGAYMVRDLPPASRLVREPAETAFYEERMVGHAVLGEWSAPSTLAHELGHAVLDLAHDEDHEDNLMFAQRVKLGHVLTPEQCARGRAAPRVFPIR